MAIISDLNIKRFRGIRDLKIASLDRVNLIVGDNNCGKTSVLEALQLSGHPGIWQIYIELPDKEKVFWE